MLGQTSLKPVVTLYKNEGETPLECLDRFRVESLEYKDAVLSYIGRLDPMAEGLLLVLVGEENKNREKYLGLDKVYEVDVLFGVETDTGDVLGKVQCPTLQTNTMSDIVQIFTSFVGMFTQKYPHYSSKPVNGKPLFWWAREGKLDEIEIPEKTSEIYNIKLQKQYSLKGEEILKQAEESIKKVNGDFRQQEIIASWKENFLPNAQENFSLVTIEVHCSSGTYMRTLAEVIAKKMGTTAIAWKIKRLKVANYSHDL
ncbi:MAG: hypothetical protein WC629_00220 [Candidatus Paceibacterota bacterium]|jgi:tRNA pseudouridine55 synthase